MSDLTVMFHASRQPPQDGVAPTSARKVVAQNVPQTSSRDRFPQSTIADDVRAPIGPFDRLLRELQQSTRPATSRLDEPAAAQMFEPRRNADSQTGREASQAHDRASDAAKAQGFREDRFGTAARRAEGTSGADSNFGTDFRSRASQDPLGSPSNLEQISPSPQNDADPVHPRSGATAALAPSQADSASSSSTSDSITPKGFTRSSAAEPTIDAATNSPRSPRDPAPQKSLNPATAGTSKDDPRSTGIAQKLATTLARLVGKETQVPSHNAGSFQSARTKATGNGGKPAPPSEPTRASHDSTKAANAETEAAAEPAPFDAIVRSIRLQGGPSRSSARIHLNPPELGSMTVHVRVRGDQVRVDVRTDTAEAARRLHSRVADLQTALRQQGLTVEAIEVSTIHTTLGGVPSARASEAPRNARTEQRSRWTDHSDRSTDASESTSRVTARDEKDARESSPKRRLNLDA